jgi:hypothetical protein
MRTPSVLKRALANRTVQAVLSRAGALYIGLVLRTTRWREHNGHIRTQLAETRQPFILCFWHNRLLLMPYCWRQMPLPLHMLISAHRDGQLISQIIGRFGLLTVEGSKNKQGALAFRTLKRHLKDDACVGITPDGPRGPRCVAGKGAVVLAQMAGVPLVPIAIATSRRRMLRSWDRFLLAWPFGRGVLLWGEPLTVPAKADADEIEACRLALESRLNALSALADQHVGHTPIPPAEIKPAS